MKAPGFRLFMLVLVGAAACSAVAANSGTSSLPSGGDLQDLQAVAASLGSGSLDPEATPPTSADAVRTTRGAALELTYGTAEGDTGDPSSAVYVVQLQGSFRGYLAKGPTQNSVDSIEGKALVFLFDIDSKREVAWGISLEPHELSKLGEVFSFPVNIAPTHPTLAADVSSRPRSGG